jgi:hypothetical protein
VTAVDLLLTVIVLSVIVIPSRSLRRAGGRRDVGAPLAVAWVKAALHQALRGRGN